MIPSSISVSETRVCLNVRKETIILDSSLEHLHSTSTLKCFGSRSPWRGPMWRVHKQMSTEKTLKSLETGVPLLPSVSMALTLHSVAWQSHSVSQPLHLVLSASFLTYTQELPRSRNCHGLCFWDLSREFRLWMLTSLGGPAGDFSRALALAWS